MRRPLILARWKSAFGHVIYELKCPSRVFAAHFLTRAMFCTVVICLTLHGSIWVSFMKMFVIPSEFLDFAIASYCVILAPEMHFARWKSVVRHVIYELNAQAVFLHTFVCASLQGRFLSTGAMVSLYYLPSRASP